MYFACAQSRGLAPKWAISLSAIESPKQQPPTFHPAQTLSLASRLNASPLSWTVQRLSLLGTTLSPASLRVLQSTCVSQCRCPYEPLTPAPPCAPLFAMAADEYKDDVDAVPSRLSKDSLSSVSTTSLVFDRINDEMAAQGEKASRQTPRSAHQVSFADDPDHDDTFNETDTNDLETGPFLGAGAAAAGAPKRAADFQRRPMDKGLRRVLLIFSILFVCGWFVALGVFVASGAYRHASESEHDPDADFRGSGKAVTLDQIHDGFWRSKSHTISWIASPDGQDGLLLERGAQGKDYLVVEDVRVNKGGDLTPRILKTAVAGSRTLMKSRAFQFGGKMLQPDWLEPSPDLAKVLLGVDRKSNWRHSFTATYYVFDVASESVEPLDPLDAGARVQLAAWSPQSDAISFTKDNNLYIRHLTGKDSARVTQVTRDGGPEFFYGIPDWVYEEEVFGGRRATWWSEDGKYLAFLRTNETLVPEFPVQYFLSRPSGDVPDGSEELYPEVRQIKYPKAGAPNPFVDLQFYDVASDDVFSVTIAGGFADDNRIINNVLWAGDKVLIKETNRVSDILRVIQVDVAARSGKTINTIDVDKLDGGWYEISHTMTYIPADPAKGRPHDGYVDAVIQDNNDHLAYFTPLDNPDPIMLTSGDWEVVDAPSSVDLANNLVYFSATKESPLQRHTYSVKLDGSDLQPLTDTSAEGYYSASFSSGAGFVLLSYAGPRVPFQKVISTPSSPDAYDKTIEDNKQLADRARTHELPILKYGTIDLDDGVSVTYVERRPPHFDPHRQYPVLFQQYSGPGSQTVTKRFAVDFQSYVASALGYLVVTVDPRGTGFRGRRHRVAVRSRLGVLEAADHIAAASHFAGRPYVDASRLAIWGWSYGGFMTLKALEQDAGRTFSYGMAVAPVTDWRFYDSVYTERYMRTPQDNAAGYDASRVSNASALGQSTRFLLMHGVSDDNVHFQNSLTLLDELDLAGVENYDVHVFPDSDHGIYFHNANRIIYDSKSLFPSHTTT